MYQRPELKLVDDKFCFNCGKPYRHETVDGVRLIACPECRAKVRRQYEDRHVTVENMFGANVPVSRRRKWPGR
jgi:hypothetical protein